MVLPFFIINKYLYVGFVLVGLFQGLFSKDLGSAMSSLGIALVFIHGAPKIGKRHLFGKKLFY
jgi:hypothetical protein